MPFLFIGRNSRGLWVVREADGRTGGIFLFRKSALHFAARASAPMGYATMLLDQRLELDVENRGNPLVAWLDWAVRRIAELIRDRSGLEGVAEHGAPDFARRGDGIRLWAQGAATTETRDSDR
jgi:hypothetical protein